MDLILLLILNSLWCAGFYTVTYCEVDCEADGQKPFFYSSPRTTRMILWRVRFYSIKLFGEYWSKPICTCLPCMASIHSLWFWAFNPFSLSTLATYVFYAFALAGLNKIVMAKFDL